MFWKVSTAVLLIWSAVLLHRLDQSQDNDTTILLSGVDTRPTCQTANGSPFVRKDIAKSEFEKLKHISPLSHFAGGDGDVSTVYFDVALQGMSTAFAAYVSAAECARIGLGFPISKPLDEADVEKLDCMVTQSLRDKQHLRRNSFDAVAVGLIKHEMRSPEAVAKRVTTIYRCFDAAT